MANVIRNLLINVGVDLRQAQAGFAKMSKELKSAGKKITGTGEALTKGLTMPVLGTVAALGVMAVKTLNAADNYARLSQVTGISTERLQELAYVGQNVDVELETMTGAQAKLIRAMSSAKDGSKAQKEAFEKLGVSITDNNGNLRNSNDIFIEAIAALGKMENPTERDAAALRIFGKSALELNPLIKAGADEINNLTKEARENGAVLSSEEVKAMDAMSDALGAMKLQLMTAASKITMAMMPALEALLPVIINSIVPAIQTFAGWIKGLVDWFSKLSPPMQKFIGLLVGLVVAIGPLTTVVGKITIGIGKLFNGLSLAVKALRGGQGLFGALSALLGPAGLVVLAIAGITLAVGGLVIAFGNTNPVLAETRKNLDEINKKAEESKKAFDEQNKEIDDNAKLNKALADELYALNDKENKSNVEKARMQTLVKQLNDAYPDLNLAINEQTGALNKNRSAVEGMIKAKEKELRFTAYEERMKALIAERIGLEEELAKIIPQVTGSKEKTTKADIDLALAIQRTSATLNPAIMQYEEATKKLKENGDAYDEVSKKYGNMASGWLDWNKKLIDSNDDLAESDVEADEERLKALEEYNKKYNELRDDNLKDMDRFNDEGIKINEITAAQIKKNNEKILSQYRDFHIGIKKLVGRIPPDILMELSKIGPSITPLIADLNNMTTVQLQDWVKAWKAPTDEIAAYTAWQMNNLVNAAEIGGQSTGQALANGFFSKKEIVFAAGRGLAESGQEGANTINLYGAGQEGGEGMARGLRSKSGEMASAGRYLAKVTWESVRNWFMSRSPSVRFMKLGATVPQGLAKGIINNTHEAIKASQFMARGVSGIKMPSLTAAANISGEAGNIKSVLRAGGAIEIPLYINGKEFARATANDYDRESKFITTMKLRGAGA